MVPTILCTGQQRRHRHKEQTFGLNGRSGGMIWWIAVKHTHMTKWVNRWKTLNTVSGKVRIQYLLLPLLFYYYYHCEFAICHCKARNSDFLRTQGGKWPQGHCVLPSWAVPLSKEVQGLLPKGLARPIISQLNSSLFHIIRHKLPQLWIQTRNTQVLLQRAPAPGGEHPPGSWVLPSGR